MYAAQRNGDLFGSDDSGSSWSKLNLDGARAFRFESGDEAYPKMQIMENT